MRRQAKTVGQLNIQCDGSLTHVFLHDGWNITEISISDCELVLVWKDLMQISDVKGTNLGFLLYMCSNK